MKHTNRDSAFRIPHCALRRSLAFVVAQAIFCSSVFPAWAGPEEFLRPRVTAQGQLRQELEQIERLSLRASDGGRARQEIQRILDGNDVIDDSHGFVEAEVLVDLALKARTPHEALTFLRALDVSPLERRAQRWVGRALLDRASSWPIFLNAVLKKRRRPPYFYIVGGRFSLGQLKQFLEAARQTELALHLHWISDVKIWLITLGTSDLSDPSGQAGANQNGYFRLKHSQVLNVHSHPLGDDVGPTKEAAHDQGMAVAFAKKGISSVIVTLDEGKELNTSIYKKWGERHGWRTFEEEQEAIGELVKLGMLASGESRRVRDGGGKTVLGLQTADNPSLFHSLDVDRAPRLLPTFP